MSMNSESQRRWSKFGGFDARTASKWSTWHPTGLTPSTSAPGLGSPLPHLPRDWAHIRLQGRPLPTDYES
jgi:hypothetical protein